MRAKGGRTRAIPVPEKLQAELKAWRKAQRAEQLAAVWWDTEHDWILSTEVGTHWDPTTRARGSDSSPNGHPAKGRRGHLPGAMPHSMRHATATILLEEGVPMRVVSELLGPLVDADHGGRVLPRDGPAGRGVGCGAESGAVTAVACAHSLGAGGPRRVIPPSSPTPRSCRHMGLGCSLPT